MSYRPYNTLSASSIDSSYVNESGIDILKGTPVRQTQTGGVDYINVSVPDHARSFIGVAAQNMAPGMRGSIVSSGRIIDVIVEGEFGDSLFIDKYGLLTNESPDVGEEGFVNGDMIICVGVIVKNNTDPLKKDIIISYDLRGEF